MVKTALDELGEQDITKSLKSNSFTQIMGFPLPADLKTVLQLVF